MQHLEVSGAVRHIYIYIYIYIYVIRRLKVKEQARYRRKQRAFGFPCCFLACNCYENHHWHTLSCSLTQVWKAGGRHLVDTFRAAFLLCGVLISFYVCLQSDFAVLLCNWYVSLLLKRFGHRSQIDCTFRYCLKRYNNLVAKKHDILQLTNWPSGTGGGSN